MGGYYSDDYGMWEDMEPGHPDFEDNLRFYKERTRTAVRKKCRGCGRQVRIQPEYAYCDSCATKLERGGDLG